MAHYVDVHAPGKPPVRRDLDADLAWVRDGSGAELRRSHELGGGSAVVEIRPLPRGVDVAILPGHRCRLLLHGGEVSRAELEWSDEIFIDDVRLVFVETAERGSRALLVAVALVVLALGGLAWAHASPSGISTAETPPPPEVYRPTPGCTASGAAAEGRAFDVEATGRAKRERYAFDTADGVGALPLFDEAVACFGDAGRIQDAYRVQGELSRFRELIEGDYASQRLRLKSAMDQNRTGDALVAVREIGALLCLAPEGPYRGWLRTVESDLERKLQRASPAGR